MANLNYDKLLDYLKHTQRSWKLHLGEYPKGVAQYKATCKALKESKTVEKLKLLFSAGIEAPEHISGVLNAIASRNQIINLSLRESSWPEMAFRSLISFVTNNQALQSLILHSALWTPDQLEELTTALKTCPNLTKLDLGDLFALDPPQLMPVANYLNAMPTVIKCLFELDADHSEFLSKNLTRRLKDYYYREPVHGALELDEDASVTVMGSALFDFWHTLPADLTKHVLYEHLNLTDLTRFVSCSKVTLELTRRWPLWKEYYLTHFSCVTAETLELINLLEGWQLLSAASVDRIRPKDPWQLVLKYTFTAHGPLEARDFPRDRRPLMRRLMAPVYHLYPQLIGCASATYEPGVTSEQHLRISNPALNYVWFGAVAAHTYSLGFELLRDDTINAIMLYHYNTQDSTKRGHWLSLYYVFDWFTTKSTAEFQTKMKPLVDILLAAQESNNFHRWPSKYRDLTEKIGETLQEKLPEVRTQINDRIIAEAKDLAWRCNPNPDLREEFADMIHAWIDRVKQCGQHSPAVPDYVALKQVLTAKTAVNEQWAHAPVRSIHHTVIGDSSESVYMQYTRYDSKTKPSAKIPSNRPVKRSGPTAVTILVRTLVNLIVMPLLKSFWPRDLSDPNYRVYPHEKNLYQYNRAMYYLYHKLGYVSFEHVSVSHAHPEAWPIIAVAVAHLLLTPLCHVLTQLMHRTWTSTHAPHTAHEGQVSESGEEFEVRLDELIRALTRIGLIPHEHIVMLRKLLVEFSDTK